MPDQYTIRARVLPALLVALPVGFAALAWFPNGLSGASAVAGLIAWSGTTVLVAQLGRDAGRRKQPELFRLWGGPPATRRLRHSGDGNRVTRERARRKLMALMHKRLPTQQEEAADPQAADDAYEGCVEFLKGKTRDRKKFNLVFEENCNYGFRRNLWGLKPLGIVVAALALTSIAVLSIAEPSVRTDGAAARVLLPGGLILLLLVGWAFVVTPQWVAVPANAYADRLMEATDQL